MLSNVGIERRAPLARPLHGRVGRHRQEQRHGAVQMMERLHAAHSRRFDRERRRDATLHGWRTAHELQPGDAATTDYECGFGVGGRPKLVTVTARAEGCRSQSGVMFQVVPPLKNNPPDAWFDAEWFAPVTPNVEAKPPRSRRR